MMPIPARIQYACAVLLVISSIALAYLNTLSIGTIAHGVLIYIAQAFLLAASIFGLDGYLKFLSNEKSENHAAGHPQQ